jgi:4-amino-4-deoxy-L-arabinose transferase-like glycosyltransferase
MKDHPAIHLLKPLLSFIALSVAMRFFSFFPSVINHDESTYIVIADGLLKSKTYFADYIDTKPIGIFLLFAAFLKVFPSIFALRVITALWVALTAFALYSAKLRLGSDRQAAMASGVMYIFLCSIFTFYGVAPNTELYYCLFTCTALWAVAGPESTAAWVLAGLSLGLGFMLKYVVLFDAAALGLFLLWRQGQFKSGWGLFWVRALLMAAAMALPFTLVWAYYNNIGLEDAFRFYTFEVMKNYPVSRSIGDYAKFLADFFLRFLPVTAMFFYALFAAHTRRSTVVLALLWSALVLAPVMITGRLFGHYFIQLMPVFALLAGEFFATGRKKLPRWLEPLLHKRVGYPLLGIIIVANIWLQKKDYFDKPDYPREIAAWLRERLQPGETVYAGNFHQITYYLLPQDSPTPYVHRSLLWEPHHLHALGIEEEKEWNHIIAQSPRYVLYQGRWRENYFTAHLASNYREAQRYGKDIVVFEKKKE